MLTQAERFSPEISQTERDLMWVRLTAWGDRQPPDDRQPPTARQPPADRHPLALAFNREFSKQWVMEVALALSEP
jgi:hypothetical protein